MSGYIGPLPVPQGIQRKQSFTATASQTTFNTNGYTDGNFINVYLNGVRLINGTDYTATNGSDIVLTTGASASDVLDFETFDTFELVNQTFDNVTLKNPTHEDTDGGRESAVSFKGEQSGGEVSTLAQIQASHDGTSDDQKGALIFKTNDGSDNDAPTEAMRLDSNRVAIVSKKISVGGGANATSPDAVFTVQDSGAAVGKITAVFGADENTNTYTDNTTKEARVGIPHYDTDEEPAALFFASSSSSANEIIFGGGTSRMNAATSIKFRTAANNTTATGTERWQITSDGHFKALSNGLGIDFSASEGSGASSSILDDFEVGSWTPALENQSGTSLITPTTANGSYVKIGNSVQLSLYMSGGTLSGSASQVRVVNLPFVAESGVFVAAAVWPFSGFTALSSGETIIVRNSAGSSYLAIQKTDGGTSADVTNADFGGSLNFSVQISYETV
tara:strand:- start:776 stop:2119 length:1344 start_codon:yes stop_codon:yes gene_type:complete